MNSKPVQLREIASFLLLKLRLLLLRSRKRDFPYEDHTTYM